MKTVSSISALKMLLPQKDAAVYVSGYYCPNDGGDAWFLWNEHSEAIVNEGTVVESTIIPKGRWLQQHQGKGNFKTFGIMDNTRPADNALDALINDPAIQQVSAFSNLLLQRRHTFHRSNILLDFQNHSVLTQGIENAPPNDPFAAVLFFQGKTSEQEIVTMLKEPVQEQTDIFPVTDASAFEVAAWYTVQVNVQLGTGTAERELQKLVQIITIIDPKHIQISYSNGWLLDAGRVITWQKVTPVQDVTIKNMHFYGAGADPLTGSHPIAFEYAVHANVFGIHATGTFWPVVMRRWNTHYITQQCSLTNPPNTAYGGAGYLTQQIYCLYGHIMDCYVNNARHLNDFTASAYCLVENCHANGQSAEKGPFVTHGQYEHDLTYTSNSGLMTFANSGSTWGGCAKRISVRKHVCPWFVARYKVIDLTLEDVVVIANEAVPGSGMMWVNADGLQMKGCSTNRTLRITQVSQCSGRKNVITQCYFSLSDDQHTVIENTVSQSITFRDTRFSGVGNHNFASAAALTFIECEFNGTGIDKPIGLSSDHLSVSACQFTDCSVELQGQSAKHLDFSRVTFSNSQLNFSTFAASSASSVIFSHNRLLHCPVVNKPNDGPTVIWEQNITQG